MRLARRGRHCAADVLDGRRVTARMERHLATCPECAALVAGVRDAARATRAEAPPLPPDLDERVLAAALDAPRAAVPSRPQAARRRPALVIAAAAAAAMLVIAVFGPVDEVPVPGPTEARAVEIVPLSADCATASGRAAAGSGRIVVAGVWAGAEARRFATVLRRFEERTGVRVTYAYETRNIAAKLKSRMKRGCAPDVALLPQPGLLGDLARSGDIRPLADRTRRLVRRNYASGWRRLATVGGRQYGVWFKATYKSTFWYRPDALHAAGVAAPPATWAELLETSRRVAGAGIRPLALAGASPWTLTDWFENLYLQAAGPKPYEDLAAHRIPWTDPSVTQVLRRMADLFADERLVGTPRSALETSFEESVAAVYGRRPSAAMVYEADFVRSFLPRDGRAGAATFFRFPGVRESDEAARGAAVVGGDVAVQFNGERATADLMHHLATADAAAPWARAGGFLSPNRAVPPSAYPDALSRRVATALASTATVRFDLSDLQPPAFGATAEQGMWSIFQDFLADPGDPEATARALERAAKAAWTCQRAMRGSC